MHYSHCGSGGRLDQTQHLRCLLGAVDPLLIARRLWLLRQLDQALHKFLQLVGWVETVHLGGSGKPDGASDRGVRPILRDLALRAGDGHVFRDCALLGRYRVFPDWFDRKYCQCPLAQLYLRSIVRSVDSGLE